MKKYIVLSVNENVDYLFFTPLTCWAWRKFGWEPIVFFQGQVTFPDPTEKEMANSIDNRSAKHKLFDLAMQQPFNGKVVGVNEIPGYRSDTITQISRLYGAAVVDFESYLMTGDIDMLPLSDYWKPNFDKVTVWGHDLTGFGHFPICYIGAHATHWINIMNLSSNYNIDIKRDLDTLPQAKDPDFYKYWYTDQDLITARLKEYDTSKIDFINRGQGSHGYARGRVDRGHNGWVLDQPELIDCHMQQQTHHSQEKIDRLMALLRHVWPKEDFTWFEEYTKEFKRLAI